MKPKTLAGVAAFMVAGAAGAVGPSDLGLLDNISVPIENIRAVGPVVDLYTFSVSSGGIGVAATLSDPLDLVSSPGDFHLTFSGISFIDAFSDVLASDFDGTDGWSVAALLPTAGSYAFLVLGTADGTLGGAYRGGVGAVVPSPIPEPSSLALLLAGLGVLGFVARRRRS
jgi:hypothetical protein